MISTYTRFSEFLSGTQARKESQDGKRISAYRLKHQLGQGAFAKVVHGRHSMTGDEVAIKRVVKPYSNANGRIILNEIHLMARLDHPNLVFLFQVVDTPTETALVMELGKHGTLNMLIEQGLERDNIKHIFQQLAGGVCYMHNHGIAHRDIKADNIFIASNSRPLLGDFGFATDFHVCPVSEVFCGSPMHCAPEILKQQPYQPQAADIWAMGVLLSFMLNSSYPFPPDKVETWTQDIVDAHCAAEDDAVLHGWLADALQMDPKRRALTDSNVPRAGARRRQTVVDTELLAAMSRLEVGRDVATEQVDIYCSKQAVYRMYQRKQQLQTSETVPGPSVLHERDLDGKADKGAAQVQHATSKLCMLL